MWTNGNHLSGGRIKKTFFFCVIKYYSFMARGLAKTPLLLVELLMHALCAFVD